jgi:GxxExxY protein
MNKMSPYPGMQTKGSFEAHPQAYERMPIQAGLRLDMLVEKCLIVEIKAVEKMIPIYEAQLLTYLNLANIRLGLLINFNTLHLEYGIKRIIN